jgi:SP family general alpha glucoside:H+ symporter-like MFS transporter
VDNRLTSSQGGICFLCIIYTYFRVPEPSGRSFAELDLLFERGVSARKFKKTEVNVFAEIVDDDVLENYEKQKATERTKTVFV